MFIEFLALLAHRNRARHGTQRRREHGHVTLACPACHALSVSAQYTVEEFVDEGWGRWQVVRESYQCSACKTLVNADAFKNDGTGVMKVRTWDCPACKADNTGLDFRCKTCGFTLR